jgi:DNA-binding response OmpR family regulator
MPDTPQPKRILIIDDEPDVCEALAGRLQKDGFEVRSALSGERGLELAFAEHPDLIMLDLLMPGVNGWELLRRLRADEWGRTVGVIVLTNVSDPEGAAEAVSYNVYDYIVKTDWKLEDVVKKVAERLDRPPERS